MDDKFKVIADLFQVPVAAEPTDSESGSAPTQGAAAEESRALGTARMNDGDYEAAILHFRRAVAQRDASDSAPLVDLAGALSATDQLTAAYRQYERALRQRNEAEPRVGLAEINRRYGRWADAVVQLEAAIELEPNAPGHHFKLADTFREMGSRKRAYAAIQGAIAVKPDEPFYHYWAGDLLLQMDRASDALDAFRAAMELSPGDDYIYLRTAVAFWRAQRSDEAIKSLGMAIEMAQDSGLYHALRYHLFEALNRPEDAIPELEYEENLDDYDRERLRRLLSEMGVQSPD